MLDFDSYKNKFGMNPKIGEWVTTELYGKLAVCIGEPVHDGNGTWYPIRYKATRFGTKKTIWVQNSVLKSEILGVRKATKKSREVLKLTGPYGEGIPVESREEYFARICGSGVNNWGNWSLGKEGH